MITDGGDPSSHSTNFNDSTITFNDAGDTATLLFTNSKYYLIANNGYTNRINYKGAP